MALVRPDLPEKSREDAPPEPPSRRGAGLTLRVAEPTEADGPPFPAVCAVLTHPAFDRPAVVNDRRPGPKRGAVSLTKARRQRECAADEAARTIQRSRPPHDLVRELVQPPPVRVGADRVVGHEGDDAVIGQALALLDARLRRPGAAFDTPARVRAFLALHLAECEREEFRVMFLTHQHALIACEVLSLGTLAQTHVYPREVVRRALALNAGAVILAHNHPSGVPEPSRADEYLTASLKAALALVDVRVLDHLIVGRLDVVSMAERGML